MTKAQRKMLDDIDCAPIPMGEIDGRRMQAFEALKRAGLAQMTIKGIRYTATLTHAGRAMAKGTASR